MGLKFGYSAKTASAVTAIVLACSSFAVTPSWSRDDSGSTIKTPTCKKKMVWDKRRKKCVRVKKSSQLDDENIYEAARDLAYHRRYEEALDLLDLAENGDDPRILNIRGYATRKLGRIREGLTYYTAALKADPDYTLVREYMGEAFLQLGQVDKALEQLTEIEKRCGSDCHDYAMLDKRIKAHLAATAE